MTSPISDDLKNAIKFIFQMLNSYLHIITSKSTSCNFPEFASRDGMELRIVLEEQTFN